MIPIYIQYHKTIIGELIIGSYEDKLCLLDYRYRRMRSAVDARIKKHLVAEFSENSSPVIELAIKQIKEYLSGTRTVFDIPLLPIGTDFQQSVWKELLNVPFGKKSTYLELSKLLENEKAIRAVASANGANAIAIIIPCHRIIGSDGALVGYAGGLSAKKILLDLESKNNTEQLELGF